jgi:hypothetical protein
MPADSQESSEVYPAFVLAAAAAGIVIYVSVSTCLQTAGAGIVICTSNWLAGMRSRGDSSGCTLATVCMRCYWDAPLSYKWL